jgi:tetratricopeptide (TPR) repeat protein
VSVGGDSLVERLVPHVKKIAVALGITAVVLVAVFTVRYFKERGREKKSAKIARVLDVADRQIRPAGEEPDPKAKEPTFANAKERAEAVLDAMAKNGTDAGGGAYKASLLLQADKVDEAIAEYRKVQATTGLDGVLAREGLGIALETKAHGEKDAAARQKDLEDALAAFKTMQPNEQGPRYAYALYHQGRILALLGKTAEAKSTLEKAKELGKDGELPTLIDERLASLGS